MVRLSHGETTEKDFIDESIESFLDAIIAQHGCNDHAWLVRTAHDIQLAIIDRITREQHNIQLAIIDRITREQQ